MRPTQAMIDRGSKVQAALQDAREVSDRAMSVASPHGLFSEQVDPDSGELLGNYPQTLRFTALGEQWEGGKPLVLQSG